MRQRDRRAGDWPWCGSFDDVGDSSAFHRRAALIVDLLRCNGFVFVESKGVMLSGSAKSAPAMAVASALVLACRRWSLRA